MLGTNPDNFSVKMRNCDSQLSNESLEMIVQCIYLAEAQKPQLPYCFGIVNAVKPLLCLGC